MTVEWVGNLFLRVLFLFFPPFRLHLSSYTDGCIEFSACLSVRVSDCVCMCVLRIMEPPLLSFFFTFGFSQLMFYLFSYSLSPLCLHFVFFFFFALLFSVHFHFSSLLIMSIKEVNRCKLESLCVPLFVFHSFFSFASLPSHFSFFFFGYFNLLQTRGCAIAQHRRLLLDFIFSLPFGLSSSLYCFTFSLFRFCLSFPAFVCCVSFSGFWLVLLIFFFICFASPWSE